MNTPAAGALLDQRYELSAPAHDRGLGESWEARDQQHGGRAVVVKFLRPVPAGEVPKELADLAKSLRAFRNDHVLTVINHGVWSGRPYLVYERFEGRSIGDALDEARKAEAPLALPLLEAVFERACDALHAGHKAPRQVLHLALTPGCVLFRGAAADATVRVLDFGVAKHAGADPTAPVRSARALRSPAPEQLVADGRPGVPADVFGLGALLREMLSLPAPVGMTLSPAGLERRRDDVPAGVWDVIARALAARPEDRFPTVAALQEAARPAWRTAPPPKRSPLRAPTPPPGVDVPAAQPPRARPMEPAPLPVSGPLPSTNPFTLPALATPPAPAPLTAPAAPAAPSFPTEEDEDSLLSTMAMEQGGFDPEPTQAIETMGKTTTDVPAAYADDVAQTQEVGEAAEEFLSTMAMASPLSPPEEAEDAPGPGERTRVVAEPSAEPDPLSRTMAVDPQALQRIATAAPPRVTTGARPATLRAPTVELPPAAPAAPAPAPAPAPLPAAPPPAPVEPEHTARYKLIVAIGILFIPVLLGLLLILRR